MGQHSSIPTAPANVVKNAGMEVHIVILVQCAILQQQLAAEKKVQLFRDIIKLMSSSQQQAHIKLLEAVTQTLEPHTAAEIPRPNKPGNPPQGTIPDLCVDKMTCGDDPEAYFNAFERMVTTAGLERAMWVAILIPCLIGPAKQAVDSLAIGDITDNDKVKSAILKMLNLIPEAYHRRLHNIKFRPGYQLQAIGQQIRVVGRRCLYPESMTKEQVAEAVLVEYFMAILPFNSQSWLLFQCPATLEKAAIMMEAYVPTHVGLHLIPKYLKHKYEEHGGPNNTPATGPSAASRHYAQRQRNRNVPESIREEPTEGANPTLKFRGP